MMLRWTFPGRSVRHVRSFSSLDRPLLTVPSLADQEVYIQRRFLHQSNDVSSHMRGLNPAISVTRLIDSGHEYYRKGMYQQAKESYLQAHAAAPHNHEAVHYLGCVSYHLKNDDAAHEYFKQSYELDSTNERYKKNYLCLLHKVVLDAVEQKKYEAALEGLEILSRYDYYLEFVLYEKGKIYLEQDKPDQAKLVLSQLLEINPEFNEAKDYYYRALVANHIKSYRTHSFDHHPDESFSRHYGSRE